MALALALVLHAHQPAGNFDAVIEANYQSAYRPFLEAAGARPWLRLNLHYSGFLLDWLAAHHPGHIDQLRGLALAGRVEVLGGGYFEPILAAIPAEDQQEQLTRLGDAVERLVGRRPQGAWLAERVWEPELPAVLARAGVEYTLLDDAHFQAAGMAAADLYGYWHTESQGATINVVPSNFALRQSIPFRPERESLEYLLEAGRQHPGALLTMGDDLEKFGAWPHTAKHVYQDGWLERFFNGLEAHAAEVTTVCLSHYIAGHAARGLIYLPTGSYPEMMRWAGNASWRGFLTKYPEANLLHKTQWDLTRRLRTAAAQGDVPADILQAAHTSLLAAECNDVYWHGWFGGLYSPHLRNLAFTRLLEADAQLPEPPPRRWDLHGDGTEVIELRSPALRLVITPQDGGTIEELDLRGAHANLINSLQRRPEPYHAELRAASYNPAHLPDASGSLAGERSGESLNDQLRYDPYPRSAGRLYVCRAGANFTDFQRQRLDADANLAGGAYTVESLSQDSVQSPVERHATLRCGAVTKRYAVADDTLTIEVSLEASRGPVLLEMVFNLLAADASDRYFEHGGERRGLRWAGELGAGALQLHDGWRGAAITLEAEGANAWWIEPLYTVSQSEAGFETNYQGSSVVAVFPAGTTALTVGLKFFL